MGGFHCRTFVLLPLSDGLTPGWARSGIGRGVSRAADRGVAERGGARGWALRPRAGESPALRADTRRGGARPRRETSARAARVPWHRPAADRPPARGAR